jgi:hypothetical protein
MKIRFNKLSDEEHRLEVIGNAGPSLARSGLHGTRTASARLRQKTRRVLASHALWRQYENQLAG